MLHFGSGQMFKVTHACVHACVCGGGCILKDQQLQRHLGTQSANTSSSRLYPTATEPEIPKMELLSTPCFNKTSRGFSGTLKFQNHYPNAELFLKSKRVYITGFVSQETVLR